MFQILEGPPPWVWLKKGVENIKKRNIVQESFCGKLFCVMFRFSTIAVIIHNIMFRINVPSQFIRKLLQFCHNTETLNNTVQDALCSSLYCEVATVFVLMETWNWWKYKVHLKIHLARGIKKRKKGNFQNNECLLIWYIIVLRHEWQVRSWK